jgi:tetratricopeptide (TPR) repeat protein
MMNIDRAQVWCRSDWLVGIFLIVLCLATYANVLDGKFVYDDRSQIVDNTLIQSGQFIGKALRSQVWAFRGDWNRNNYWRPTFTAWLILNYRWFGLQPAGWHVTNVLLHGVVVFLLYLLLVRLQLARKLAVAVSLVYAVHPANVESVAWISGSPSMLVAIPLLGSLLLTLTAIETGSRIRWIGALGLYGIALGAKEIAVLFPVAVALVAGLRGREGWKTSGNWQRSLRAAASFGALASLFFVARLAILGRAGIPTALPWHVVVLTLPSALAFYLRQAFFPYWLGPVYPIRVVDFTDVGITNVLLPSTVLFVATVGGFRVAMGSRPAALGAVLFLLMLAPAMNLGSFSPEQLVHDRYLYLPLAGLLLFTVSALAMLTERLFRPPAAQNWVLWAAVIASVPLWAATVRYNRVWTSQVRLWAACVEADPTSSDCLASYGKALAEEGQTVEARKAVDRSLAIRENLGALALRGDLSLDEHRFSEAERDFRRVLAFDANRPDIYQRLAILYQDQRRFDDGIQLLREARIRIPDRYSHFTDMIAALLVQAGRRDAAVHELEAVRDRVRGEIYDQSRMVLFNLGVLYRAQGDIGRYRAAWEEFVGLTSTCTNKRVIAARREAVRGLGDPIGSR